jgi:hypothetical protein
VELGTACAPGHEGVTAERLSFDAGRRGLMDAETAVFGPIEVLHSPGQPWGITHYVGNVCLCFSGFILRDETLPIRASSR